MDHFVVNLCFLQHAHIPLLCNWVIKNAYCCHSVLLHVLLISNDQAADADNIL